MSAFSRTKQILASAMMIIIGKFSFFFFNGCLNLFREYSIHLMWFEYSSKSLLSEISMKLNVLLVVIFFVFLSGCAESENSPSKSQSEIDQISEQSTVPEILARRQLVRLALSELKAQSLYTDDTDWGIIEDALEKQIGTIQTDEDMKKTLNTVLNHIRDSHGRFFYKDQMFAHFTDWGNERNRGTRPIDQDARHRFEVEHNHQFELLGDYTGYVKIKGIGTDINEQAVHIRSNLEELAKEGAKNWILDLRYNTGGNLHPMMAGIGPLLCNGVVGGEANAKGEIIGKWTMTDGNFYLREYNEIPLPVSEGVRCNADVAVLISRYTVSSGEAVATTFKGRPNSKFFGEFTGGLTTVTNWEPINEELTMSIAVSYYADRNNNVFKQNLHPDENIEFSSELALNMDPAIIAAQNWLIRPRVE